MSVTVEKNGEGIGPGQCWEVVCWVIRDSFTDSVTFEGKSEDMRAGAKGCSGREESRGQGSGAGPYTGETSEKPVPGWRDELQFEEEGRKLVQRVTQALWGQACQHWGHCRHPAYG